jgi:stress response protein SCP2
MAVRTYTVGDEVTVQATVKNGSSAVDLTGATVLLRFSLNGDAGTEVSMTVTDAAAGECQYQFTSAQIDEEGHLLMEVEVTDSGGTTVTSEPIQRNVRNKL